MIDKTKISTIKPLSELVEYMPLMHWYKLKRKDIPKNIIIDTRNTTKADVVGTTIFISNIVKTYSDKDKTSILIEQDKESPLSTYSPTFLIDFLREDDLNQLDLFGKKNLRNEILIKTKGEIYEYKDNNKEALFFIPNVNVQQRDITIANARKLIKDFFLKDVNKIFHHSQISQILIEIIKNTVDHSDAPGVLALSMFLPKTGKGKFTFCHCEIGGGICQNVRDFLSKSKEPKDLRLSHKGGFTDFLYWAFKTSSSSKINNGINMGLGLSTIESAARGISMSLYLKDADSIFDIGGIPDEKITHSSLRKHQVLAQHIPCFMYFGHIFSSEVVE